MKWSVLCVAIQAAAVASLAATQSSGDMKMSQENVSAVMYTGCIEAGSAGGTFTLTHVAAVDGMAKDGMSKAGMSKEGMSKDGMAKDSMAKDGMAKDSMKADTMNMDKMDHDSMAPAAIGLMTKPSIDLRKHVGQKVSITGIPVHGQMNGAGKDTASLNVASVKTIAKSCS
jgi:pentapeptide MXKDX repeat protein